MFGKSKLNVTVLYSAPLKVRDTRVLLDGEVLLQFKDVEIGEHPPILGTKSVKLNTAKHELDITDSNFGLRKKQTFELKKETWVDIIIHDDSISVHILDKQPHYK